MRSKRRVRIKESDLIDALVVRKENYERYFEQKEDRPAPPVSKDLGKGEPVQAVEPEKAIEPDHKAEQAYTGLIKTIVELMRKSGPAQASPEEMRKKAKEILETEYGIKR